VAEGIRLNYGKPRYSLINYKALEPLVRVLEFGEKKYTRSNWTLGLKREEILDSLQRHVGELIDKYNKGVPETDEETEEHIIGHIMANCLFYSYHMQNNSFTNEKTDTPF
jgi:hypothetical protein